MIISITEEQAFGKIQQFFIISIFHKTSIEGHSLNLTKNICTNPIANVLLIVKCLMLFPKLMNKRGCLIMPLLFKVILEVLAKAILQKQEIKCMQIEMKEVKPFLFPDTMILHIENSKTSTKNKLLYKSASLQDIRTKENTKSIEFLNTIQKHFKNKIKRQFYLQQY